MGLDPGIDHFLALKYIRQAHFNGCIIESFISYCGGLPAPEYSANPLRYKFSWSPRGVLLNTLSSAKYLWENDVIEIAADGSLMSAAIDLDFIPELELQGFPNRDSTIYAELYGLDHNLSTLLRGSIRYKGFAESVKVLTALGLISTQPHPLLQPDAPSITWVNTFQ